MQPERWKRIKQILAEALEQEPRSRLRWVRQQCQDDPETAREIKALLESESRMGAFLESPPDELQTVHKPLQPIDVFQLEVGQAFASYEVIGVLGEGGMGKVYLARDTKLGRPVALKFVSARLRHDPLHEKRLIREARAAAALDHPYICKIYETGQAQGQLYIALEYVEGQTLQERLKAQGPLPLQEALSLALEIAQALEKAHEKHIAHRDLKPSNIMIDSDGHVKLMDFGLAKPGLPEEDSETLTRTGLAVGTLGYMSPEQLRAETVDIRSDIFSFGVVLAELLSGVNPFRRDSDIDTASAVINDPPPPLSEEEFPGPPLLLHTLSKMLAKPVSRRYQSVHEVRTNLEMILADARASDPQALPTASSWEKPSQPAWKKYRIQFAIGLAAAFALGLAVGYLGFVKDASQSADGLPPPSLAFSHRFEIPLPPSYRLASASRNNIVAISPDGRSFVFAAGRGNRSQLFIRRAGSEQAAPLERTRGARAPFFSPDGKWIAFFADGQLIRLSLSGGARNTVCQETSPHAGGSFIDADRIAFASETTLYTVPAAGGTPRLVAAPDNQAGEAQFRWPHVLPGGHSVLVNLQRKDDESYDDVAIAVVSLQTGQKQIVFQGARPRYSPSGHLLYARSGDIYAVSFDPQRLQAFGEPRRILEGLAMDLANGAAQFDVSQSGSLVVVEGAADSRALQLGWVSRQGEFQDIDLAPLPILQAAASPTGNLLAASIGLTNHQIWWFDLQRATRGRVTVEWDNHYPVWLGDEAILFASTRPGLYNLYQKQLGSRGAARALSRSDSEQFPYSVSPDKGRLIYVQRNAETQLDILQLALGADGKGEPLHATRFNETHPRISPDGNWLAFQSDESGRGQIYVEPYPQRGKAVQISIEGGQQPIWSPSSQEIFYRSGRTIYRVAYRTSGQAFLPEDPQALFEEDFVGLLDGWDISADGQSFLMARQAIEAKPGRIVVLLN